MKKIFLVLCATSAMYFISCSSDTAKSEESTSVTENNSTTSLDDVAQTSTASLENATATNAPTDGAAAVQANATAKPGENPYKDLKGNNPAHGQPGHRCDINVGEPLNTPPRATPTMQPNVATPQPAAGATSPNIEINNAQMPEPAPQKTAPGFSGKPNPPHGQPGHRCDFKDGEILP